MITVISMQAWSKQWVLGYQVQQSGNLVSDRQTDGGWCVLYIHINKTLSKQIFFCRYLILKPWNISCPTEDPSSYPEQGKVHVCCLHKTLKCFWKNTVSSCTSPRRDFLKQSCYLAQSSLECIITSHIHSQAGEKTWLSTNLWVLNPEIMSV